MPKDEMTPAYPLEDFVSIFNHPAFAFLPKDLEIGIGSPPQAVSGHHRFAQIFAEDSSSVGLRIFPEGFAKQDLLTLREEFDGLMEGISVEINGNQHTIALFSSCVRIEDHAIEQVELSFDIDPFAE